MHSYVAFLMYPDIRRMTLEELTPQNLTYIKKEYPDKRQIAKSAGFAIKIPFIKYICGPLWKHRGKSSGELRET